MVKDTGYWLLDYMHTNTFTYYLCMRAYKYRTVHTYHINTQAGEVLWVCGNLNFYRILGQI